MTPSQVDADMWSAGYLMALNRAPLSHIPTPAGANGYRAGSQFILLAHELDRAELESTTAPPESLFAFITELCAGSDTLAPKVSSDDNV